MGQGQHIVSPDPLIAPAIEAGFLTYDFGGYAYQKISTPQMGKLIKNIADVLALLEILKFIMDIGRQEPLSSIIDVQTTPGSDITDDEGLIAYV